MSILSTQINEFKYNLNNYMTSTDYKIHDVINSLSSIPLSTSQLVNDSEYATSGYVDTGLATKQNVINNDNKLDYSLLSSTPTIPLSTSQLTNDSDFQTSNNVQEAITTSIADKADMSYVDSQDAGLQAQINDKADMSHVDSQDEELQAQIDEKQNVINNDNKLDYSLLSSTPTIPLSTSQLANDSNYQNAMQVNTAVDTATSGKADITYVDSNPGVSEALSGLNDIFTSRELLNEPLCFEPIDKSTNSVFLISVGSNFNPSDLDIEYSLDKVAWIKPVFSGRQFVLTLSGDVQKVYVRGNNAYSWDSNTNAKVYTIRITDNKQYKISGNINSLIRKNAFNLISTISKSGAFMGMFSSYTHLVDASELILPATTLAFNCYNRMFYGCTSLTSAPALQALNVGEQGYSGMFIGCTALTGPVIISATTLGNNCCINMFNECSALNSIEVNFTEWGMCDGWVTNVAATGTFTKPSALPETYSENKIPTGWTVINK